MAKKKATDYISEWMAEFGPENGYELSRCEFVKEGGIWYLRVFVDRLVDGEYGYMSSDDCETVSRFLSEKLDKADPIPQEYYLEVSSPGLDRQLITQKDFDRFAGQAVEIRLYKALDGKKMLEGTLVGLKDGIITIADEKGNETAVPQESAAKVNLAVVF